MTAHLGERRLERDALLGLGLHLLLDLLLAVPGGGWEGTLVWLRKRYVHWQPSQKPQLRGIGCGNGGRRLQ